MEYSKSKSEVPSPAASDSGNDAPVDLSKESFGPESSAVKDSYLEQQHSENRVNEGWGSGQTSDTSKETSAEKPEAGQTEAVDQQRREENVNQGWNEDPNKN